MKKLCVYKNTEGDFVIERHNGMGTSFENFAITENGLTEQLNAYAFVIKDHALEIDVDLIGLVDGLDLCEELRVEFNLFNKTKK